MRSRDVSAGALARRRVLFILAMSSPKTSPVRRAEIKSSNSPKENKNKMLVSFLCDFFSSVFAFKFGMDSTGCP